MFFLFSFLSSKFYTSLVLLISATKHSNELITCALIATVIPFYFLFFVVVVVVVAIIEFKKLKRAHFSCY